MKVEILKENLKSGISFIERVAGKNLSLPILSGFLVEAKDNLLNIISTDLQTSIKAWILCKVLKSGKTVIPQRVFSGLINSLPNGKITIELVGQNLKVECGDFKTQIQCQSAGDFPIIPRVKNENCQQVNCEKLSSGLSLVADIASPSQTRPEISGVYFNLSKNILRLAATDSFRLGEKSISMEKSVDKEGSFILPQKSAKEVINVFFEKEGDLKICYDESQALFEFSQKEGSIPRAQVIGRLIEGEYPNYQEIIPNKFITTITLKREEFLNQIKTSALFAGRNNEVKISIDPKKEKLNVFAQNSDVGESKSQIPVKAEGQAINISFNYKYLIDGLSNIKSSEVNFNINREDGPCVLSPLGDGSYLYVVMPIKPI